MLPFIVPVHGRAPTGGLSDEFYARQIRACTIALWTLGVGGAVVILGFVVFVILALTGVI